MVNIANGDQQSLFAYYNEKSRDVPFEMFYFVFNQKMGEILASWEINSIFDKNGQLIKHY